MNPRALRVNKQQKNFFGFTCPLNPSGRLVSDFLFWTLVADFLYVILATSG